MISELCNAEFASHTMNKDTLRVIMEIIKVVATILAGYLGGAVVSSCAHSCGL